MSKEADLSLKWEDGMVELKCSPPPPHLRADVETVAKQCPRMATLAKLLLKEDVFEALPWQSQVPFYRDIKQIPQHISYDFIPWRNFKNIVFESSTF